jgi:two-component system chemotaxis sensor kinase CheA
MSTKEEKLIEEFESILNSDEDISSKKKDFEKLLKAYKRSYKQLNKIIKISDKQQEELKELSDSLNEKSHKVRALLDNADQGFLSFGNDFIIDEEYSKECSKLLGDELAGKDISDILYLDDEYKKSFFKEALLNVSKEEDEMIKNAMLSLLPKEVIVNRRAIKLDYKTLSNDKFMVVLTNITKEKILEKKIKKEQEILKMIVTIVSDPYQFYDLKDDFLKFAKNKKAHVNTNINFKANLHALYRDIHTFKGSFAQLRMQNCVKELHILETKLSDLNTSSTATNQTLFTLLDESDMIEWLDRDLSIIKEILGIDFFEKQHKLEVDDKFIFNIEDKITHLMHTDNKHVNTYEEILTEITKARGTTLNQALSIYPKACQDIALSLGKSLNEFKIIGGDDILTPIHFKPFIKSLIHLFRNAIDHGIEEPESRLEALKSEYGNISCNIKNHSGSFEIIITDDGAGIDTEKLKQKVLSNNIYTQLELSNMTQKEILELVFFDSLSTSDDITELSGRGIGMGTVKSELEKLSGEINIESEIGKGTTFTLKVPTSIYGNLINIASDHRDNITIEYILSPVVNRATTYLQSDMKIDIKNKAKFSYIMVSEVKLKDYCSYIHISGLVDVSVCISYDSFLLDKLLNEFNQGHPIEDDMILEFRESISKEVINIVVGNALFNPYDNSVLEITTPQIITQDELMAHDLYEKVAHVIIDTQYGEMHILVGKF